MPKTALSDIRMLLGFLHRNEIQMKQAEKLIAMIDKASLAEFIVDAFNRGWINNRNLGMDDEGYPI